MDSFFEKLKSAADIAGTSVSVLQEKVIQEYLPNIVVILREKAGTAIFDILSDIDKISDLARTAYQALPMPVRLVVKEQNFIDWVISHQGKLVEIVRNQSEETDASNVKANILMPGEVDISSLDPSEDTPDDLDNSTPCTVSEST